MLYIEGLNIPLSYREMGVVVSEKEILGTNSCIEWMIKEQSSVVIPLSYPSVCISM